GFAVLPDEPRHPAGRSRNHAGPRLPRRTPRSDRGRSPARGADRRHRRVAEGAGVMLAADILPDFTPLPTSPARGEVLFRVFGDDRATASMSTLPLAGRVGEGVTLASISSA